MGTTLESIGGRGRRSHIENIDQGQIEQIRNALELRRSSQADSKTAGAVRMSRGPSRKDA